MPSKLRENSPERRSVKKESSKLDKTDRTDRKERHKSSSHRKSSNKDRTSSRTSISPENSKRRSSMPGILKEEAAEDLPQSESKTSLPYPSFSKAHSKEAVGSRPSLNIFTPPATDLNASKDKLSNSKPNSIPNGPPSPPLTEHNTTTRKVSNARPVSVETIPEEDVGYLQESRSKVRSRSTKSAENLHKISATGPDVSPVKVTSQDVPLRPWSTNLRSSQRSVSQPTRTESPATSGTATSNTQTDSQTNLSSDATSIAPEQVTIQRPGSKILPIVNPVESRSQSASVYDFEHLRESTPLDVVFESEPPSLSATPASNFPPPPPPPPVIPLLVPKVDYLLRNGGLNQSIPKNLLFAGKPMAIHQAATSPSQPPIMIGNLFEPYNQLLDDFNNVMSKNGSLAVATGYRSVARRLLDRLEAVFARDISSETCQCSICENTNHQEDDMRGVSWGEILELVSGRRDLPNWPPFSFETLPQGLGLSFDAHVPMQKLDIDVPEEYREHYIRQSRKTKQSVDRWLNRQNENPTSPPEEVDDETLTFAILTHIPSDQRPIFKDLLGIVDRPLGPPIRAPSTEINSVLPPTPGPGRMKLPHIAIAAQAIQRLYRLAIPPRDPETAIFMLNNPTVHNAMATLAAVSNDEWEILISGRFDGFLRSGAEDMPDQNGFTKQTPFKTPSRGPTPAHSNGHMRQNSYSRAATPAGPIAQYGAPIAFDEETEIATLAEIERDIYTGMEALEDAFEALHLKAEVVRRALRERSAGLAATALRRRGPNGGAVEVRMGTPASSCGGGDDRWEAETDDGLGDWEGISELAPDDSASNISTSRRRRPKRRNERRTPALIEEDELEDYGGSEGTASPKKR